MGTLIMVAQFLLSLSLLIVLHEWGHYFFARLFKTKVNKFYLFFDFLFPIPTLLNFSLFKKKVGDTEFGLGWFPLGGYVQIDGMMDETQDAEKLAGPPQPWEFRSKKPWQRLFIMLGGIIVNVLVAFIVYGFILFVWGENKVVNASVKNGIAVGDSLMYQVGFKDGDKIISVNGNDTLQYFDDVVKKVIINAKTVQLDRGGQMINIAMPVDLLGQLSSKKIDRRGLIGLRYSNIVGSFEDTADNKKSNAFKVGIKSGDRIIAVNGKPVSYFNELYPILKTLDPKSKVTVTCLRGIDTLSIVAELNETGALGIPPVVGKEMEKAGDISIQHKSYSFFSAFPAGVAKTYEKLVDYIDQFKLILSPKTGAYKGMGGFASMSKVFYEYWDWERFWNMTAMFSIILAFMNLLPIPMLDGGYVLFTLFEMITGRKLPNKFLEIANNIGFFIIIGLMLYTNGNDIFRKIMGRF